MWQDFTNHYPSYATCELLAAYHFCDNLKDATTCANLVLANQKKATATSLWWYQFNKEVLPSLGDLHMILDWEQAPKAILEITKVEQVPFREVSAAFAREEGEGDLSLAFWKKVHWDYYTREMAPYGERPTQDMLIICEYFRKVWPI